MYLLATTHVPTYFSGILTGFLDVEMTQKSRLEIPKRKMGVSFAMEKGMRISGLSTVKWSTYFLSNGDTITEGQRGDKWKYFHHSWTAKNLPITGFRQDINGLISLVFNRIYMGLFDWSMVGPTRETKTGFWLVLNWLYLLGCSWDLTWKIWLDFHRSYIGTINWPFPGYTHTFL